MLIITLGTQASGSTWVFNVVRALFACVGEHVFSSSADDGLDALDRMPIYPDHVILKSHSMDQRLLRIARLARAKVIVSTRDPLDSVVSQKERFGHSSKLAAVDLTRSFATIESLPSGLDRLNFRYEESYTTKRRTIFEIAGFLGLRVSRDQSERIFRALEPEAVKAIVQALEADSAQRRDPGAYWHPNHVGDGRVGKWRDRLVAATQSMVSGCLAPLASPELWKHEAIRWSADLFSYGNEKDEPWIVELECEGDSRILVFGPYLHLPCGRWRATPLVEPTTGGCGPRITADVYLPNSGREALASREARAPDLSLRFDHHDHFQPVEVRLASVAGSKGGIRFSGCELNWLGPPE